MPFLFLFFAENHHQKCLWSASDWLYGWYSQTEGLWAHKLQGFLLLLIISQFVLILKWYKQSSSRSMQYEEVWFILQAVCVFFVCVLKVAAGTLDASTKIYAVRVDAVHADAYRVLGGLGAETKPGEGENLSSVIYFLYIILVYLYFSSIWTFSEFLLLLFSPCFLRGSGHGADQQEGDGGAGDGEVTAKQPRRKRPPKKTVEQNLSNINSAESERKCEVLGHPIKIIQVQMTPSSVSLNLCSWSTLGLNLCPDWMNVGVNLVPDTKSSLTLEIQCWTSYMLCKNCFRLFTSSFTKHAVLLLPSKTRQVLVI